MLSRPISMLLAAGVGIVLELFAILNISRPISQLNIIIFIPDTSIYFVFFNAKISIATAIII